MSFSSGRGFSFTIIAVLAAFGIGGIVLDIIKGRNHTEPPVAIAGGALNDAGKDVTVTSSIEAASTFSSAEGHGIRGLATKRDVFLKAATIANRSPSTRDKKVATMVAQSSAAADKAKRVAVVLSFSEMEYQQSSDGKGEVALKGKADPGAKLRFLLDGEKLGEASTNQKGIWQLSVKHSLEPGPHWIVVEQVNDAGKVVAKAESPFDRSEDKKTASVGSKPAKTGEATVGEETGSKPEPADEKSGGIQESAKKIWDKFAGIFQVNPNKKNEKAAPEAGKPADNKKEEKSASSTQKTTVAGADKTAKGKAEVKGASPSPKQSFAFSSITYKEDNAAKALMLSGYAAPGTRVRLFAGDEKIGEVVADNVGNWNFEKKGKVTSGTHLFRAARILPSGKIDAEISMQYDHVTKAVVAARDRGVDKKILSKQAVSAEKSKAVAQAGIVGKTKAQISNKARTTAVKEQQKSGTSKNKIARADKMADQKKWWQEKKQEQRKAERERRNKRLRERAPEKRRFYSAHKDKSKYYARKKTKTRDFWRGCGYRRHFLRRRRPARRDYSNRRDYRAYFGSRGCRIIRPSSGCDYWRHRGGNRR